MSNPRLQVLNVGRGSADSTWKGERPLELLEASLAVRFVSHPLHVAGVYRYPEMR